MNVWSALDAAGRRRSPATLPGYHAGRPPRNKGMRYPALALRKASVCPSTDRGLERPGARPEREQAGAPPRPLHFARWGSDDVPLAPGWER
jgi:hypothetical protein